MKIVGITGGIGSGKTTICKIFELLNVPVFYADDEAKKLYGEKKIIEKVVRVFGNKVLDKKKKIDKKKLAGIVFNDRKALSQLNAIIHPEVKKQFEKWMQKQKGTAYVIKEAAIMIESGSHKELDYLITVSADPTERIQRIIKRDKASTSKIEKRIKEQISDKEREKYADVIIHNDGRQSLINQVLDIHQKLLKK